MTTRKPAPPEQEVAIFDVACEANVSNATVSQVINNKTATVSKALNGEGKVGVAMRASSRLPKRRGLPLAYENILSVQSTRT